MTTRTRVLTTMSVVAAAGVLGAAGLSSASATPNPARTLTFLTNGESGGPVDTPPTGMSAGDEFFEHGKLTSTAHKSEGTFALAITLVDASSARQYEDQVLTLYLAHGTIQIDGGHASVDTFTTPVVGGTGSYAGVRGTATQSETSSGHEKIVVRLLG